MTREEILQAAWRSLAANPSMPNGFPRGFWPDLAAVAVEMALQGTLEPELDFRPTMSGSVVKYVSKTKPKRLSQHIEEVASVDDDNPFKGF
jgi:hypothetical protein